MGNGIAKLSPCCFTVRGRRRHVSVAVTSEPLDDGLGHSFCYVHEDSSTAAAAAFSSISGAALSANASTLPSNSDLLYALPCPAAAASFESTSSFSSAPLQPLGRFPSGPLPDRPFLSGPIDRPAFLSGPIDPKLHSGSLARSVSLRPHRTVVSFLKSLSGALSSKPSFQSGSSDTSLGSSSDPTTSDCSGSSDSQDDHSNLQWAQGKAGEDRVHVVVSEEQGWVFVGIYDGFNGPDATDHLLANLYPTVRRELKGLLWDEDKHESRRLDRRLKGHSRRRSLRGSVNHQQVLKALSLALKKTEQAYLDIADKMIAENPELALMGSCVLVMMMKGDDVYLMNVGDSRAILAQKDVWRSISKGRRDLGRIKEETWHDHEGFDGGGLMDGLPSLGALQLTVDHSTSEEKEVKRIKSEHPDDASAIANDRVKGSLKVTRAFGAGFLKLPKWNNALLEMFRIDYVGNSPYITCDPFLHHRRLGLEDRFLILSSDGLFQYFTNEEAVAQVELYLANSPEGDPAQHLVEEVLFRAAEQAGMDFHELLEIPQGDRRRYHDDVSVIVVSLEGRIWRSCV